MQRFTDEYAMLEVAQVRASSSRESSVIDLKVGDLRPFLPAKDFEVSKDFYLSIGCRLEWEGDDLALLYLGGQRFYLQRYFVKEWAENCMLHLSVEDADSCYRQVLQVVDAGRHPGAKVVAPKMEAYGALVTYVWDPSGVLLHLAQWSKEKRQQE